MIANPRRTTLAHLKDASELLGSPAPVATADTEAAEAAAAAVLPRTTANPRRTKLNELPKPRIAP
ncbi:MULTISPECIES: hypothetical protein [Streptomycetaceae]|jgi:hypothetical protein|uniref:hypothetical protein n=1 Tax=Streptomycetaceae TaxID=2062 RepID=UPI00300A379E